MKNDRTPPEGWVSVGGILYSRPLASQTVWSCVWAPARTWWRSQRQRCSPCPPNAAPAPDETVRGSQNTSEHSLEQTNITLPITERAPRPPWRSASGSPACCCLTSVRTYWAPPYATSRTSDWPWTGPKRHGRRTTLQRDHRWRGTSRPNRERLPPDLAVVDDDRPEVLPCFCVVKRASSFADLHQQRLPLVEIFSQTVVDVLGLHVPQTLVLEPHLTEQTQSVSRLNTLHSLTPREDDVTLTYCSTSETISFTAL